jgi:enediyne biosynthesis protein E5
MVEVRTRALRRFALSITIFNLLGHTVFGFEQAWIHPFAALATCYPLELAFEWLAARERGTPPRYRGGFRPLVDFLLSAHITGMAVSMLLYPNERVGAIVFAAAVAISSKALLRVPIDGVQRHFLNPSNFGITVTLLAFHWVGVAPPYQFSEHLSGAADWLLPAFIVASGAALNVQLTRKHWVAIGWVLGFATQAVLRWWILDASLLGALAPLTGVAVVLFTFYMVTDPATTPDEPAAQLLFGVGVALAYGALVSLHVVFGMFFALTLVSGARGALLALRGVTRETLQASAQAVVEKRS